MTREEQIEIIIRRIPEQHNHVIKMRDAYLAVKYDPWKNPYYVREHNEVMKERRALEILDSAEGTFKRLVSDLRELLVPKPNSLSLSQGLCSPELFAPIARCHGIINIP
jgi:hypothetical protein